jgi:hypothetical protein
VSLGEYLQLGAVALAMCAGSAAAGWALGDGLGAWLHARKRRHHG